MRAKHATLEQIIKKHNRKNEVNQVKDINNKRKHIVTMDDFELSEYLIKDHLQKGKYASKYGHWIGTIDFNDLLKKVRKDINNDPNIIDKKKDIKEAEGELAILLAHELSRLTLPYISIENKRVRKTPDDINKMTNVEYSQYRINEVCEGTKEVKPYKQIIIDADDFMDAKKKVLDAMKADPNIKDPDTAIENVCDAILLIYGYAMKNGRSAFVDYEEMMQVGFMQAKKLAGEKNYSKALEIINKIIESVQRTYIFKLSSKVMLLRGAIQHSLCNDDDAIADLTSVINMSEASLSDIDNAKIIRQECYVSKRDYEEGLKDYELSNPELNIYKDANMSAARIAKMSENPVFVTSVAGIKQKKAYNKAVALSKEKLFTEALSELYNCYPCSPDFLKYIWHLQSECYLITSQYDKCKKVIHKILNMPTVSDMDERIKNDARYTLEIIHEQGSDGKNN